MQTNEMQWKEARLRYLTHADTLLAHQTRRDHLRQNAQWPSGQPGELMGQAFQRGDVKAQALHAPPSAHSLGYLG